MVGYGLEARKTSLVTFDFLPYLIVAFSAKITFSSKTPFGCSGSASRFFAQIEFISHMFFDCGGRSRLIFAQEDLFIRIRECFA
jgi:hypothetical protein